MKTIGEILNCVDSCAHAAECSSTDYQCCYGDDSLIDCVDRLEMDYKKILSQVRQIKTLKRLEEICNAEREGRLVIKKGSAEVNEKLLPCPFCGGKARWRYRKPIGWVMCKKCGASSATLSDNYEEADCQQEAIAAWNSRTGNDTNVATNADRIRSMSDEELARFLGDEPPYFSTYDKYLEWLRQPAKEEHNETDKR